MTYDLALTDQSDTADRLTQLGKHQTTMHILANLIFLSQRHESTISTFLKMFQPFPEISKDVLMTSKHCQRAPKMCVKSTQVQIKLLIFWIIFCRN